MPAKLLHAPSGRERGRHRMTLQLDGVSLVRLMGSSRPAFVLASTTGCAQCDGPLGGAWEQLATLTRDLSLIHI